MAAGGIARGVVPATVSEWTTREQLVLASAVQRSGDQNWVSVSRAIRPVMEEPRQADFFSQKSCATQYSSMLDNASTPKRKRKEDGGPEVVETVEEQIVRNLTEKRIKEIDQSLAQMKEEYMSLKMEIELIEQGSMDDKLQAMWQEMQMDTVGSDVSKEPSTLRSPPSKLTKFQVVPPTESDATSKSPGDTPSSSTTQQQQKQKDSKKQEVVSHSQPSQPATTSTLASIACHSLSSSTTTTTTTTSSFSSSSSSSSYSQPPSSTHSAAPSKAVHQEHPYFKQESVDSSKEKIDKVESDAVSSGHVSAASIEEAEDIADATSSRQTTSQTVTLPDNGDIGAAEHESRQDQKNKDEDEGNKQLQEETANTTTTHDGAVSLREDKNGDEDSQQTKAAVDSNMSAVENSGKKTGSVSEEVPPTAADKGAAVEETCDIVQEQSEIMEEADEEDIVDVVMVAEEETEEVRKQDLSADDEEQQPEHDPKSGHVVKEDPEGEPLVEEERAVSERDEKEEESKIDVSKGDDEEEEEEEIEVDEEEEDEPSPSPVKVRATRSSDAQKLLQVKTPSIKVSRVLVERIKVEREDEREGSPTSLPSPGLRVRRSTRGSAKRKLATRSSILRAEEREGSVADSRDVTDQESEEELTSAFSSSVPSPAYSQGDTAQDAHHARKSWKKTIMLVWHHASHHKYAALFLHPVREEDAPGYYDIIHKPMDLSTIKRNIETGVIRTDTEFHHAMLLMFQNALMYNSSDHDVYRMAENMRNDVMTQIDEYLKTQMMVNSSMSTKALRSREGRGRAEVGGVGGEELTHKRLSADDPKKRKPKSED